jgi:phosphoribosylformylglycinamidine synthase
VRNKVKVLIPLFPGTNGELEAARGFEETGAEVEVCVVRNLTPEMVEDSFLRMAKALDESQILCMPGGAVSDSGIDMAKIAAVFFRSERAAEALDKFLERCGLVLGLGGGFQALCEMGLLSGRFALGPNGTHNSRFAQTEVVSVNSPWMKYCKLGELFTVPVSGESVYLPDGGTPATVYTDGSIEGVYNENGRIFGKMGQHERLGRGICKNIPLGNDMRLFEAGVTCF